MSWDTRVYEICPWSLLLCIFSFFVSAWTRESHNLPNTHWAYFQFYISNLINKDGLLLMDSWPISDLFSSNLLLSFKHSFRSRISSLSFSNSLSKSSNCKGSKKEISFCEGIYTFLLQQWGWYACFQAYQSNHVIFYPWDSWIGPLSFSFLQLPSSSLLKDEPLPFSYLLFLIFHLFLCWFSFQPCA